MLSAIPEASQGTQSRHLGTLTPLLAVQVDNSMRVPTNCLLIDYFFRPRQPAISRPTTNQHLQPWPAPAHCPPRTLRGLSRETTKRATTVGSRRKDASLEGTSKASMASQVRRVPRAAASAGSVYSAKLEIPRNGIMLAVPDSSREPRAIVIALRSCSRRLSQTSARRLLAQRWRWVQV